MSSYPKIVQTKFEELVRKVDQGSNKTIKSNRYDNAIALEIHGDFSKMIIG
ncbi:MAG: hypothetical protein RLZZ171_2001 [Cyanobacteriota bacterium]|jgi:hypothetical protein